MDTKFFIVHAEWCLHCITLMETIKTIGGYPSGKGEYDINGTIVRVIEQKELGNPDVKAILGDRHVQGFPTILIKTKNNFEEYNGPRDGDSLRQLFHTDKNPKQQIKKRQRQKRKTIRKNARKNARKTPRRPAKKSVSWLF